MSITANPVTPHGTVVFEGGSGPGVQTAQIYTCGQFDPERIESVYMQADFVSNPATSDLFAIQLVDASGVVLWEQVTPPILTVDAATLTAYLIWSRVGNDTAQLATFEKLVTNYGSRFAWVNLPLPDLVLQPKSYVNLLFWVDDGGEGSPVTVTRIATTVTRNAGVPSDTTVVQGIPLLTDVSTG